MARPRGSRKVNARKVRRLNAEQMRRSRIRATEQESGEEMDYQEETTIVDSHTVATSRTATESRSVAEIVDASSTANTRLLSSGIMAIDESSEMEGIDIEGTSCAYMATPEAFSNKFSDDAPTFSVGLMDYVCDYCGARMFAGERIRGHFAICCSNGKVVLPEDHELKAVPLQLMNLYKNNDHECNNFREHIRNYNSAIAFASISAQIDNSLGNGTYAFRIHGESYVQVGHLGSESPVYNQLFVVDCETALQTRMNRNENSKCIHPVMKKIDSIVRSQNPYAIAYKMFSEAEKQIGTTTNLQLIFTKDPSKDQRRYNEPLANEVAIVYAGNDRDMPSEIDFAVFKKDGTLIRVSHNSSHADPMAYPLLFPNGEQGWNPYMKHRSERRTAVRNRITMLQFYKYRLMERGNFTALHNAGKLFQQYVALSYVKQESNRLFWVRNNQSNFRVEQYQGLMDFLARDAGEHNRPVGRMIILPSSFVNSPRNMQQNYQDAMAIVNKFGKPDLFVTFTCNPKWAELIGSLTYQQRVEFRPDLVARVFHLKLQELLHDIKTKNVFGRVAAMIHVIEFQKRGLPHAHILIVLENNNKIRGREMIDQIVCAEIPDENMEPFLFSQVTKHMIHGPCGSLAPSSVCMENGACSKDYPKNFQCQTLENVDGYPLYRRREGTSFVKNGKIIDNRWIVPYNKYLIRKYDAHINVEICSSIKSVKYLYKYVYKGPSCSTLQLQQSSVNTIRDHDEIKMYVDGRHVCSPEGAWRLFEFRMHEQSHKIVRLPVHLPLHQNVVFVAGCEEEAVESASGKDSALTAFFKLCASNDDAATLIYPEVGEQYVFVNSKWKKRQKGRERVISRMYAVSPLDRERYFLRLLLLNVKGPKSFEDLRTVDGKYFDTFFAAAKAKKLLEDDEEWSKCISEAAMHQMPSALRNLFSIIIVFCNPSQPSARELFERHQCELTEDYAKENPEEMAESYALIDIQNFLRAHGLNLSDFDLPEIMHSRSYIVQSHDSQMEHDFGKQSYEILNEEQKNIVDKIVDACQGRSRGKLFFIDGPGGTGKTFLYNTLTHILRGLGKTVYPTALTGLAANLLPDGRTVHSRFKLPVPVTDMSSSLIKMNDKNATLLRNCDLFIWDEAPMSSGKMLRVVDRLLRDITGSIELFGGKIFVLAGDFRQCLPVVPRGGRAAIVNESIKRCSIWPMFQHLRLTQNMRTSQTENEFSKWLLELGEGNIKGCREYGEASFKIPAHCIVDTGIVHEIFGEVIQCEDCESFMMTAILTPCNDASLSINDEIISKINSTPKEYRSIDAVECDNDEEARNYPMEFINNQTPSGMPPHILILKIGTIIRLLRNLNTSLGLCNGTRLIVTNLHDNVIEAKHITGTQRGGNVFIPRIICTTGDGDVTLPFKIRRRQFPIRPAFAMTINAAQGQTFDKIGLYLTTPVFTHGQIYTAFSRVRRFSDIKVEIKDHQLQGKINGSWYTQNIVYKEVL